MNCSYKAWNGTSISLKSGLLGPHIQLIESSILIPLVDVSYSMQYHVIWLQQVYSVTSSRLCFWITLAIGTAQIVR